MNTVLFSCAPRALIATLLVCAALLCAATAAQAAVTISTKATNNMSCTGARTLSTNDGGSKCDFWFEKRGHVEFWDLKSSLAINGNSYTLVRSIRQLAGAVATNPAGAYALAKDYNASKDGSYAQSPV